MKKQVVKQILNKRTQFDDIRFKYELCDYVFKVLKKHNFNKKQMALEFPVVIRSIRDTAAALELSFRMHERSSKNKYDRGVNGA